MTQIDAQMILMSLGFLSALALFLTSTEFRISKWWWAVPCVLVAPIFVHTYLTAVLG